MALQFNTSLRSAMLDLIESMCGASAKFVILTGTVPANCAAAETGTRLAVMSLPSDYFSNATGGQKSLLGTWEDASADNAGTMGYFRLYDNAGTTCYMQGTITLTGGGGDVTYDNTNAQSTQDIKQNTFTITAPGA